MNGSMAMWEEGRINLDILLLSILCVLTLGSGKES